GVANGRGRRNSWGLADTDDAPGLLVVRFVGPNDDLRNVGGAGQLVPLHIGVEHLTRGGVDRSFLKKPVIEAHDHTAIDLALPSQFVDDQARILDRDDLFDLYHASFDVDGNFGKLTTADAGARKPGLKLAHFRNGRHAQFAAGLLPTHNR